MPATRTAHRPALDVRAKGIATHQGFLALATQSALPMSRAEDFRT